MHFFLLGAWIIGEINRPVKDNRPTKPYRTKTERKSLWKPKTLPVPNLKALFVPTPKSHWNTLHSEKKADIRIDQISVLPPASPASLINLRINKSRT